MHNNSPTPVIPKIKRLFHLPAMVFCLLIGSTGSMALDGKSYPIPGVPFQVFAEQEKNQQYEQTVDVDTINAIVKAFTSLAKQRSQHQRFDQALNRNMLQKVVIEPKVFNRDGKEFPFLVARTKQKGKVKLLISASRLKKDGYLNKPDQLTLRLAKEFQWVISKASTKPKPQRMKIQRDLKHARIFTNTQINNMSQEKRGQALEELFQNYLLTMDTFGSLAHQPFYKLGEATLIKPDQSDSTTKLYDIRIREALAFIVQDPYFFQNTPKAVRSLLNGKIWHVMIAKIDERDWTTRTRVVPKDKTVKVGEKGRLIQPAKVLVNYHRSLDFEEDLYAQTQGLPMGALSAEQLARVLAWEIQNQITEKSMRGHVAQDEKSSPTNK